jgi:tetratricopeptide (TPR) repeat protein
MDEARARSLLDLAIEASSGLRGPDAKASLDRLESEHDELLAALAWFVENGHTDDGLSMSSALYRLWITSKRFDEGAAWFDRVLGAPGGDDRLRAKANIDAGFMPFWLGDDERAGELFGRGLEIARQVGDQRLISQALGGLARVALRTDVAEGRRFAREALDASQAANDDDARSNALHLLGVGAQIAGDLVEARDWMTQRLALVRPTGNEFLVASEAGNLSMVERQLGNLDEAERLDREALEICERIGDEFTKPFAIAGLAAIATERGDFERAATLVGAAEAVMEAHRMAWPPDERPHYERMLTVLPESMGSATFEEARAAGRSMAAADVVSLAMGTA